MITITLLNNTNRIEVRDDDKGAHEEYTCPFTTLTIQNILESLNNEYELKINCD